MKKNHSKIQLKKKSLKNRNLRSILKLVLLMIAPFLAGLLLYVFLTKVPSISKKIIEFTSSGENNSVLNTVFSSIAILISILFCIAVAIYLYVDYKAHSSPLKAENPNVPYTLGHHTKLVVLPLIRYKKKKISFVIFYPVIVILILGISVSASLNKVFAASPSLTTETATQITQTSATLNGEITADGGNAISNRGFEYGVDTNYGQTLNSNLQNYGFDSSFSTDILASFLDVSVDSTGDVFAIKNDAPNIIRFNSSGVTEITWGTVGSTEGQFQSLRSITIDSNDNIYISDQGNHRIQKYSTDGTFISMWGWGVQDGSNTFQVCTSGCQAGINGFGDGQMDDPMGIAHDSFNNIYVVDHLNERVNKYSENGAFLATFGRGVDDGSFSAQVCTSSCQKGWTGTGAGEFTNPQYVTVDNLDNIYVSELNNQRIQKFEPGLGFLLMMGWGVEDGSPAYQICNTNCRQGTLGAGNGQFCYPEDMVVNSDNELFVADYCNYRVQRFAGTGAYISQWGTNGTGQGEYTYLYGLGIDNQDRVFTVDGEIERNSIIYNTGAFAIDTSNNGNLNCGTNYHFRAFATNNDGTSYGSDVTFETAACNSTVPSAPLNLTSEFSTSNAIPIEWEVPATDGGDPITGYIVEYKKTSDISWTVLNTNTNSLSEFVAPLDPSTSYDIRVAANNGIGTGPYVTLTASSYAAGGIYSISDCDDLHLMDFDPTGTFTLTANINCAGYTSSITFDPNMVGFTPIGFYNEYGFEGTLDGDGYKISNLKIDLTTWVDNSSSISVGLFRFAVGATVRDIRLENIDYDADDKIRMMGGFAGLSVDTSYDNVSISGDIDIDLTSGAVNGVAPLFGGITGGAEQNSSINKTYSEVNISSNIVDGESLYIGGLVGFATPGGPGLPLPGLPGYTDDTIPGAQISNSYFSGNFNGVGTINSATGFGGIASVMFQSKVTDSYSAGDISLNGEGNIGGITSQIFAGETVDSEITKSFSASNITQTGGNPQPYLGGIAAVVIYPGPGFADIIIQDNFYDKDRTNLDDCFWFGTVGVNAPPESSTDLNACASVNDTGNQPNYFINNSSNEPLNTWNFNLPVWYSWTNDFPKFIEEIINPTPPPPPPPPPPPTPSPTPTPSPQPNPTPTPTPTPSTTYTPPKTTSPPPTTLAPTTQESPTNPGGLVTPSRDIFDKAEKVKVKEKAVWPTQIPYFFLSLLLIIALLYSIQSWREYRRSQEISKILKRFKITLDNIQAFLNITAHYLNTPVAIMQSSIELLSKKDILPKTISTTITEKLKSLGSYVATIQNNAQVNLTQSSDAVVSEINTPDSKSFLQTKEVWLPLLSVAVSIALVDVALIFVGGYKQASIRYINHLMFFGLGAILILITGYFYHRQKSAHQALKQVVNTESALNVQKSSLLGQTAESLEVYTRFLRKNSDEFRHIELTKTYFNGLAMLQKLTESLTIAQSITVVKDNLPLQSIKQTSDNVVKELESIASQKQVSILNNISPELSIQADPAHASFLVRALVENAIKFSPNNSSIELNASNHHGGVMLTIKDQGPGIASDKLKTLFQPFSRGSSTEVYDVEGLGMGLYNSKLLVEQLGGTISLDNRKPTGVVVSVLLPKLKGNVIGQFGQLIKSRF